MSWLVGSPHRSESDLSGTTSIECAAVFASKPAPTMDPYRSTIWCSLEITYLRGQTALPFLRLSQKIADYIDQNLTCKLESSNRNVALSIQQLAVVGELLVNRALDNIDPPDGAPAV